MYRLPQSVSGTLIIILPLRKSDKENRYRVLLNMQFFHSLINYIFQFVYIIDSFLGGNKKRQLSSILRHPRLHQFFEC